MHKKLKEMIFAAETVAHMKGFEAHILPLTEYVKFMSYQAKDPEITTVDDLCERSDSYLDKQK